MEGVAAAAPSRALLKRLVAIAVPVCVASLITNLTSFIDLISVMNRLGHAITRHPGVIEGIYEGLIPGGVGRGDARLLPLRLLFGAGGAGL